MPNAFLHTKLRKQILLKRNTDEAAEILRKMGAEVDSRNPDKMPFQLQGKDFYVEGLIERWHGTESRIRFEGQLSLPPFNQNIRNWLLSISVILSVAGSIFFIMPLSMQIFGTAGIFTFFINHLLFALIVAVLILIPIFYFLSVDPLAQRRWDAQQRLADFGEAMLKLTELESEESSEEEETSLMLEKRSLMK